MPPSAPSTRSKRLPDPPLVYEIKVTLRESSPAIWRRIEVLEIMTLAQFHDLLQIVMGWENYHLHEFTAGSHTYGNPEFEEDPEREFFDDEREIRLKGIVARTPGTRFSYVYDFGDFWQHDLLVEGIVMADREAAYPRCSAGERRCPPEDVGSLSGYQRYLEILADPEDEEHQDMLDWRGPFDSELFSVEDVNAKLRKRFRSRPKKSGGPSLPPELVDVAPPQDVGKFSLVLTGRECELIRNESFAPEELIDRLQPVPKDENHLADFLYTADELEELAGFIAAEGNHPQNSPVGKEWDALFERILALLKLSRAPV